MAVAPDTNVFGNLKSFSDYDRANQAFQIQKALQLQQMQTDDTTNQVQQYQLANLISGKLTPEQELTAKLKIAEINAGNPSIFANQHPITLESLQGGGNPAPNMSIPAPSGSTNPMLPALVKQESGGNVNAISPKGAAGPFQIMPDTAKNPGFGVTPLQGWDGTDPRTAPVEEQQRFANDYLNAMQQRNGGNPQLAAASYNAGPGAVDKVIAQLPKETQNYVANVAPSGVSSATPAKKPNAAYHIAIPPEGQQILASLQPEYAARVQGYIDGTIQMPPAGSLARSGASGRIANQLLDTALQIDPSLNEQRYGAMQDFIKPNSKTASTVKSFGVALSHLDVLSGLADALQNGDVKAINAAGNTVKSQLGVSAPNTFEGAKQIVGDELTKAIIGAGGGEADRQGLQATLSKVNSPEQLTDMIKTYKLLMGGQIQGFKQQYESASGGREDFFDRFLPTQKNQLNSILSGEPAPTMLNSKDAANAQFNARKNTNPLDKYMK